MLLVHYNGFLKSVKQHDSLSTTINSTKLTSSFLYKLCVIVIINFNLTALFCVEISHINAYNLFSKIEIQFVHVIFINKIGLVFFFIVFTKTVLLCVNKLFNMKNIDHYKHVYRLGPKLVTT